jgi:hypothetical protein
MMTTLYLLLGVIAAFVVLIYLALRSGHGYSVHDTEAHATEYAETIKEGHGRMTAFLWVCYIAILVWTIVYLFEHSSEFSIFF